MSIPAGITPITVTGSFLAPDGTPCVGRVLFTPSVPAATDDVVLPIAPLSVELNALGAFTVILAATDDPDWVNTGFTYTVTEKIYGAADRIYSISVPAASPGGAIDLATLVPVDIPGSPSPYFLKSGGTLTGDLTMDDGTDINISATGSINLVGDFSGGQSGPFGQPHSDSTPRINWYGYQQAYEGSYGEFLRAYIRKRDAKAALAWYVPEDFTDWTDGTHTIGGDPSGDEHIGAWIVAHYEANDGNAVHGHLSIELPNASNQSVETRMAFQIWDTRTDPPTFGLDRGLIYVNKSDFVVRSESGTFRLKAASGASRTVEFTRDDFGAEPLWQIKSNGETLSTDGSNAGGNFEIVRYLDDNTTNDIALRIRRSDGAARITTSLTVGVAATNAARLYVEGPGTSDVAKFVATADGTATTPVLTLNSATSAKRLVDMRVTGDSNARFRIDMSAGSGSGTLLFGNGTSLDVNLYRSAADTLKTDDSMVVGGAAVVTTRLAVNNTAVQAAIIHATTDGTRNGLTIDCPTVGTNTTAVLTLNTPTGDTTKRVLDWRNQGDSAARVRMETINSLGGGFIFGDGTVADTNLYRSAADTLKTDDSFIAGGNLSVLGTTINISSDTNLFRSGTDTLKTDDALIVSRRLTAGNASLQAEAVYGENDGSTSVGKFKATALGTATSAIVFIESPDPTKRALDFRCTGDTVSRIRVHATGGSGQIELGDGTAVDVNLYRSAADTLKTDDSMHVGANFRHLGSNIGFFNTAQAAKQTVSGSRANTEQALANLLTALATYGLITNSTTA